VAVPALVRGEGPTSELDGLARESTRDRHHEELSNSRALLAALELHDPYAAQHSRNTVRLAAAVAERMRLSDPERFEVKLVAMLHDIGKIGLPDRILNKPAALTTSERVVVNQHSGAGASVVAAIEELAHLAPAIRACHERWDGAGYPDGLAGQEIPIPSRITFVCDAYDAMTSDRPYRGAMPAATARAELRHGAGSQFCSRCVDALLEVLSDGGR
jgi:HD-GYP domain-containing protein (c-di-GMP phosphodiesterase class II)